MYKLGWIILLVSFTSIVKAQDIISLKSGETLKVKVEESTASRIRYKKFNNLEGPIYVIDKTAISKITYENGKVENFNAAVKELEVGTTTVENKQKDFNDDDLDREFERLKNKSTKYNLKRHLIGFNYGQMALLNMEFSYEVTLTKTGFISLKFPFSIGMNLKNQYLKKNNIFSTGIHINAYPLGQGKVAYFTGPAVRYFYMADNPDFFNATSTGKDKAHYIGFYMNNGVLFQATSFLNFSLGLGLGTRTDVSRTSHPSTFDVIFDGTVIFRL